MNKDNKKNKSRKLQFGIEDLKKSFQDGRKFTRDAFNCEHWDFDYDDFKSWYKKNYENIS